MEQAQGVKAQGRVGVKAVVRGLKGVKLPVTGKAKGKQEVRGGRWIPRGAKISRKPRSLQ